MTRKNVTRNALFTSIISLLLCVSMLVGTTFAWFTDSVVSGVNTIAAGNLDVELFHSDKDDSGYVNAETKLFNDVTLWEPGVVVYENFVVENKGNLALKYNLSINFENMNYIQYEVDGKQYTLADVLKVAVVEDGFEGGRAEAQALPFNDTLESFVLNGILEGNTTSETFGIVVYWAPNSNDVDNMLNINNGKTTSDEQPLHIDLGVNLVATQEMYEEDSFGDDYDEGLILPELGENITLVEQDGIQYYYDENGAHVLYLVTENYEGDTVNIPEGVDAIGNYAFAYNANVKTVNVPSTVRDLGRAFDSSSVEKVVIAEGLEVISSRAFRSTANLQEVVIPASVKVIEDNAFQKSGIKNIVIPATVETIGEAAFGASLIETVTFMGNTSIQGYAFRGCTKLHTVTMHGDDITFIPSTLNGRNSMWFCNGESNNPNTSNITFYVVNQTVASRVKTAMGAEANNTPVYIMGESQTTYVTVKNAAELQNALDNATGTTVIGFTADINGKVVATQKAGVNIIIDGDNKNYTGTLTVDGKSARYETTGLTIQNVNFTGGATTDAYIGLGVSGDNDTRYTNNVTVKNCTFSGDGVVAVKSYTGGDWNLTIDGCTVNAGMHSLVQVTNVEKGLKITNCKVYSKNGANLNNSESLEMSGCTFDVQGYAVRVGVSGNVNTTAKNFKIADSTLKSANDDGDAVIIFRDSATKATLDLVNTTLTGTPDISGATAATTILVNGEQKISSQEALNAAVSGSGDVEITLSEGEYKMPSSTTTGEVTITGTKETVLDVTLGAYLDQADGVTIEGVTIKTSTGLANGNGSDYAALYAKDVTYINCTFVGPMRVGRDGAKFVNCTFTKLGNDYIWTYGNDVTFEGCTFNTDGKAILIYSDGGDEISQVSVKGCFFNSTQGAKAGAIANQNCAAIEIHNYGNGVNLTTEGNTYDSNFSGEWRIKTYETGRTQVFVNGIEYKQIAIDGKLMTIDADKNVTVQ